MIDEQGMQTLWNDLNDTWILPEIERRKEAGILPKDFRIRRCLIKMPRDKLAIVEFNEEIHWMATVKTPQGTAWKEGDLVRLSQVERVETVAFPTVDGKRVAFFYLYWNGLSWTIVFDCSPNSTDLYDESDANHEGWAIGTAIAESINIELDERTLHWHELVKDKIRTIGLWPAPAIIPYPLSAIADHCGEGRYDEARQLLCAYCHSDFVAAITNEWPKAAEFSIRKPLIDDAIHAHREGRYSLTIHALVPQVEGIVTDWMYSQVQAVQEIPWRQESKTKKFRELVRDGKVYSFTQDRVLEGVIDFIVGGPVPGTFRDWLLPVNNGFPNRNVVGHGRFDNSIYTQENSIKLFLLLDSLFHLIQNHARVPPA